MAAPMKSHAEDLDIEIIVGTYEQVLFGYQLVASKDTAVLEVSFTDKSHCSSIRSLAVSPSHILASGAADETILLFDLSKRSEFGTLIKHSGTVTHLEYHGNCMISSDETGQICVWKCGNRVYECLKTLLGHKGAVISKSVHPSGKLLLSVGQDKTIRTWNLITGRRAYITGLKTVHDIVMWSPDGEKYILLAINKLEVCTTEKAGAIHTVELPGRAHGLKFINDSVAAVACEGGYVCMVNIEEGTIVKDLHIECNRVKAIDVKQIEGNRCLLALATSEGQIHLYMVEKTSQGIDMDLIAATKTALRPICLALSVRASQQDIKSEPEDDKEETKSDISDIISSDVIEHVPKSKKKTKLKNKTSEVLRKTKKQKGACQDRLYNIEMKKKKVKLHTESADSSLNVNGNNKHKDESENDKEEFKFDFSSDISPRALKKISKSVKTKLKKAKLESKTNSKSEELLHKTKKSKVSEMKKKKVKSNRQVQESPEIIKVKKKTKDKVNSSSSLGDRATINQTVNAGRAMKKLKSKSKLMN